MPNPARAVPKGSARGRPLLVWLGLFAALLVVPALSFAFFLHQRLATIEQETLERKVLDTARELACSVDRDLTGTLTILKLLAAKPELQTEDYAEFHRRTSVALKDSGLFVLFRAPDGQQLLNTRLPWGSPLPLEVLPDVDAAVRASDEPYVSNLIHGAVAKRPVYTVAQGIRRSGQFAGTLMISMDPERLLKLAREQRLPSEWNTGITDASGAILMRLQKHEQYLGGKLPEELRNTTLANLDKTIATTNIEGVRILRAGTKPALARWLVTANVDLAVVEAPMRDARRLLWLLGLALTAVSLFASTFIARMIAESLGSVEQQSLQLTSDAELKPIDTPVSEANAVGERMRAASRLLRARADALEEANARFGIALKGADITVFTQDMQRRYTWISGETDGAQSLIGRCDEDILPPRAQLEVIPLKQRALDHGEAGETTYTLDQRHFRLRFEPLREHGRIVGLIGVALDVTREHADAQSIRFLLAELAHRAKNMLTLVNSIATQTMRAASTPAQFQQRFTERLTGLARSQDLLLAGAPGSDLKQLVRSQLSAFDAADSDRVAIEGLPLMLSAAATQSIGMALHELATNATKHGAMSVPGGRVSIAWTIEGGTKTGRDGSFVMSWREEGGPPVVAPTRRGFGTAVLTRLIETALASKVDLAYPPTGLRWTVTAPANRVLIEKESPPAGVDTAGAPSTA